jgi:hypothetical protein
MTDHCAVIGNPVAQRESPLILAAFTGARSDGTRELADVEFASRRVAS